MCNKARSPQVPAKSIVQRVLLTVGCAAIGSVRKAETVKIAHAVARMQFDQCGLSLHPICDDQKDQREPVAPKGICDQASPDSAHTGRNVYRLRGVASKV